MVDKKIETIPFKERVVKAQNELKVPKGKFNKFGKFRYRSAEDILTGAKPVNEKYGLLLNENYDLVIMGNHSYVKAVATLYDVYSDEKISTTSFAKEPDERKPNMDEAQTTGSTISYARKYALNGLYLIDESEQDPDNELNDGSNQVMPFADKRGKLMNDIQAFANSKGGDPNNTYNYILGQLNANNINEQNIDEAIRVFEKATGGQQ